MRFAPAGPIRGFGTGLSELYDEALGLYDGNTTYYAESLTRQYREELLRRLDEVARQCMVT